MVTYSNRELTPPYSEVFQDIHTAWKELLDDVKNAIDTSAFNSSGKNPNSFDETETSVVRTCPELLAYIQKIPDFLKVHAKDMQQEAHDYLQKHRGFVWFSYAMSALYHPTDWDREQYAFFIDGEWSGYDLSYTTYMEDKARRDARGKTKNPNYVPPPHECCNNCICFWDDTPDYEWNKEDTEECEASNNIRINWKKRLAFEKDFLASNMLEVLRPQWESWTPPIRPLNPPSFDLDYWSSITDLTLKLTAAYGSRLMWNLSSGLDFTYLWNTQYKWLQISNSIQTMLRILSERYEETKETEDEIVEAARKHIKIYSVKNCFLEE